MLPLRDRLRGRPVDRDARRRPGVSRIVPSCRWPRLSSWGAPWPRERDYGLVVRKQYHFRPSSNGLRAWDVDRLVAAAEVLPTEELPLQDVRGLDTAYWFDHGYEPTVRAVVEHMRLIQEADLRYAVIVDPDGGVMDGMHRVARALLLGHSTIAAKRLPTLPPPDYTDVHPDDLPYDG
jgi:hypothetical protein